MTKHNLKGSICMIVRKWHQNKKGNYEQFKRHFHDKSWIDDVTHDIFLYLKKAPLKKPKQRSYSSERRINRVYMVIWSKSRKEIGEQGIKALKSFIITLTQLRKARMELVEYKDPDTVEIREYSK